MWGAIGIIGVICVLFILFLRFGPKGNRTRLAASAIGLGGIAQGTNWATLFDDPRLGGWILLIIGVGMWILRELTDTKAGEKDK